MAAWISAAVGLVTVILALGGTWALLQYRLKKVEMDQKTFTAAIEGLKDTIREEFDKAVSRINSLLFQDGGRPRYILREECNECRTTCNKAIEKRINKLEERGS